jgi:hypothetical protein
MGTRWQLHCKNKLCVSRGRREPCRHIGRKWHIRGLLLLGAGEVHAGRWTADGWWEGLVGRWMLTDGISWLVAVPCLDDAGTGELRQVDVFS